MASDIREGDILFDHNGEPVKVKLVQQYRSEECYEVVFDDGLSISGDKHLRLPVEDRQYRKQVSQYKNRLQFRRPIDIKTVGELYETPLLFREFRHMFSVPSAKPLQLPTQTLPVPPFVFGFWFYNHGVKQTMVPPRGTEDYVRRKFRDAGYLPQKHRQTTYRRPVFVTQPTVQSHLIPLVPTTIPNNYLLSSATQRLELLRGIMNSKYQQYNPNTDKFRFTARKKLPVAQVQFLAESLGCKTVMTYDETKHDYKVVFRTHHHLVEGQFSPVRKVHENRRFITKIHKLPPQLCVHIETDNGFLAQEGFITCL